MPKIQVSKLDAAQRQLDTAITLFFRNGEPISIHTLASASYDILHGICKGQKIRAEIIKAPSFLRPGKEKLWSDKMNEAQNFFKHAGRDSNKSFDFNPEITEMFIWDTCRMYQAITTKLTKNQFIYNSWFILRNPDLMSDLVVQENLKKGRQLFDLNNRGAFFKEMSDLYELNNQSR